MRKKPQYYKEIENNSGNWLKRTKINILYCIVKKNTNS